MRSALRLLFTVTCMGCGSLLGVDFDNASPREEAVGPSPQSDAGEATYPPPPSSESGSGWTGSASSSDASAMPVTIDGGAPDGATPADAAYCEGTRTGTFGSCVDTSYPKVLTCGHYCASIGKCCTNSCDGMRINVAGLVQPLTCDRWTPLGEALAVFAYTCNTLLRDDAQGHWAARCCCY